MKKVAVVLALMILSLAVFVPFSLNTEFAQAQGGGYSIQTVTHEVHVLYSGQTVISDTLQITGTMPSSIQVGFPFQYSPYVIEVEAYDSANNTLAVTAGVPLQDRSGFYAATIDVSGAAGSTFTVIFILSNDLLTPISNGFSLNYPAYPSLAEPTGTVDATLVLPSGASLREINKQDGTVNVTSYTATNLGAFTSMLGNATFTALQDFIQVALVESLDRSIAVSPSGLVSCTDKYLILNNGVTSLSFFKLNLPPAAINIAARDQSGRNIDISISNPSSAIRVANVTFIQAVGTGSSIEVSLNYNLPSATQQSGQYILDFDLYPYFNYYVESLSVTITPPEGATIVFQPPTETGNVPIINRSAFQETLTFIRSGVTYTDTIYQQESVQVAFNYNPLWIAFRPTIWMWAVAAVGAVIVAFMLRPKAKTKVKAAPVVISAPVAAAVGVSADQIRTFVEAYEEKIQINNEIKSLEVRVQRGRIPRRRYKERRTILESRLDSLNKTIAQLQAVIRSSGGSRADVVRQLDAAETNFNETNQELTTLEAQRKVGEISIEDYKQQLANLERRKAKAESTINGLLLRLRGEIR
jgi:hypothetical protein